MITKEDVQKIKNKLTEQLKSVRSIDEVYDFLKEVGNVRDNIAFCEVVGKRRHYAAFGFSQNPYNENKCDYLYDDSISVGKSRYENLYKVLEVRIWSDGGVL